MITGIIATSPWWVSVVTTAIQTVVFTLVAVSAIQ